MLHILSHSTNPIKKEWWKHLITRGILKIERGPDAVRKSLLRGLNELNISYSFNEKPLSETVLVISGVEALREAIEVKKKGQVNRLIAGPNITIDPLDYNKLMCDPAIDTVLVPSEWTKDYWSNSAPEISSKIKIWPAGVAKASASNRLGHPIVYNKLENEGLLKEILSLLPSDTIVFTYGQFSNEGYLKALRTAPYIIYLAESESQGLALQEAWAHDVPTIVNSSNHWQRGNFSWQAPQINAPYLNDEMGRIFSTPDEIPSLIDDIHYLHPKNYCDRELSDEASTVKLLNNI